MTRRPLRWFFAGVWLANGLGAKVLGLVPRHREIVARILGEEHATALTRLIGFSEIVMAAWILSGFRPKLCAAAQIAVVAAMNLIEFFLAPDLLLFGRWNAVVALLFVLLVAFDARRRT